MRYSEDMDDNARGLESGLSMTSQGDKDQLGLSYRLHYRETSAAICAEQDLWAIRRKQLVQVDWLVSYPLVLFI